ncbi:MAG: hypothetical protein ABH864_05825 [archaeon]
MVNRTYVCALVALVILVSTSFSVLAISPIVKEKLGGQKGNSIYSFNNVSPFQTTLPEEDKSGGNGMFAATSLGIEVIWPIEGYYYITDYMEFEIETDTNTTCQYSFEGSEFKQMTYGNSTTHYDYLFDLQDNMQGPPYVPYFLEFRCVEDAQTELTASTFFWINTSELDRHFLRYDLEDWIYFYSTIEWSGDHEGILEVYRAMYNTSESSYDRVKVYVFDNPGSIQNFLDEMIYGDFDNVSVETFEESNIYSFRSDWGVELRGWNSDNYFVIHQFFVAGNSTPIPINVSPEMLSAYLGKYPSDLRYGVCGDGHMDILNLEGLTEECDGDLETEICGSELGECTIGEIARECQVDCTWGEWSGCSGVGPENETCDGLDNDCDEEIDEDFPELGEICFSGLGECRSEGIYECSLSGLSSECNAILGMPQEELCDGLDNDCDGETDEDEVCVIRLTINSPSQEVFDGRRVQFNVTTNLEVDEVTYIDTAEDRPRERTLCRRNCFGYGNDRERTKSFRDGFHNVTFKAIKDGAVVDEKTAEFRTDSKDPQITKTEPRKGFSNGGFNAEFREDNPVRLILSYGNDQTGFRDFEVSIEQSCTLDNKYECEAEVDVSGYHGQEISYWFNLTDILGQTDQSRERELDVDVVAPILNNPGSYWIQGEERYERYIYFTFNVTEPNFDEINYVDWNDRTPRERRLCSRLSDGICEKRKRFVDGEHNLTIYIKDEAGNTFESNLYFAVGSA